jgi:hypothetical protein
VARRAFLAVAAVLAVSWPVAARAEVSAPVDVRDQVVLSGDVSVQRGTVVGEVVVFSGSATVTGVVQDDVVVLDGPVTIVGQVGGDVVALHGPIRLTRTAQVTGDVLAGGALDIAHGAEVAGAVRHDVAFTFAGPLGVLGALLASAAMAASILVCGLVVLLLAPRGADRAADAARSTPLAAAGWGVVLTIALPLLALAAGVTIVGLPLGLAVLLALGLVWLLGLAVATFAIGRLVIHEPRSRVAALLVGWAIVAAIGLVPVLNVGVWTLLGVFGLGVMLVGAWRARSGHVTTGSRQRPGRHRAPRRPPPSTAPPLAAGTAPSQELADGDPSED